MALSLWIVFEVHLRMFRFFTRWRGLYFWSLLMLAWGIVFHRYVALYFRSGLALMVQQRRLSIELVRAKHAVAILRAGDHGWLVLLGHGRVAGALLENAPGHEE